MKLPWIYFFIIASCAIANVFPESSQEEVLVQSPFGKIRGVKKVNENDGKSFFSFIGIPYAKPPVGAFRFTKPQPHPKLDDVFDASKDIRILCPQPQRLILDNTYYQEDCLFLNVHTPDVQQSNSLKKVLVFIHGGSFLDGSSFFYIPISFVTGQDTIVVTVNYRLGALGFLSTENEASPGNYGLWDQTLAIKWVYDNIRAFGGDPDDITIAGESAGAASVGYQSISPHAKGLFTKAYPHSGSVTSGFARVINAQSHALNIAKLVGCWDSAIPSEINIQESKTLVECLRKVPDTSIVQFTTSSTRFFPRVDGDFVPNVPAKLLQDDDYLETIGFFDRSYLVAMNNNEWALAEGYLLMAKMGIYSNNQTSEEQKDLIYKGYLAASKNHFLKLRLGESAASDENIVGKIDHFYSKRLLEDKVLPEIMTDLFFLIPSLDFLKAASRRPSSNSHFLFFDYFPAFMKGNYRGSPHAVDLAYWFDIPLDLLEFNLNVGIQGEFSKEDIELKKSFSALIGSFAKTGTPLVTLKDTTPSEWPKYDVTNSFHLNFNSKPWISCFLEKDKQDFWLDTVPSLLKN